MTFTDIQNEISDRLNLTSAQALARIGRSINERYRWLASSCGIDTIERGTVTSNTVIGNRQIVFNCEKVLSVFNPSLPPPVLTLVELSFDEMRNMTVNNDPPQYYCIVLMGASTVTIMVDTVPATVYPMSADAMVKLVTLSGVMTPAFAEDFHDILVYGGMATELEKMEKYDLSKVQEDRWKERRSEYVYYRAASAYKDIVQGKDSPDRLQSSVPLVP